MHPVIRVVCLVLFAAWLARGTWRDIAMATTVLVFAYIAARRLPQKGIWRMMLRLRWLVVPLILLYGWYTPLAQGWMPDPDGLSSGVARASALVVLVLAVHWVNLLNTQLQWLAAIYWLARPLAWIGVSRERVAVRLHLVLQNLALIQQAFEQNAPPRGIGARQAFIARFQAGWQWAQTRAAQPINELSFDVEAPVWWQWGAPLILATLMWI